MSDQLAEANARFPVGTRVRGKYTGCERTVAGPCFMAGGQVAVPHDGEDGRGDWAFVHNLEPIDPAPAFAVGDRVKDSIGEVWVVDKWADANYVHVSGVGRPIKTTAHHAHLTLIPRNGVRIEFEDGTETTTQIEHILRHWNTIDQLVGVDYFWNCWLARKVKSVTPIYIDAPKREPEWYRVTFKCHRDSNFSVLQNPNNQDESVTTIEPGDEIKVGGKFRTVLSCEPMEEE